MRESLCVRDVIDRNEIYVTAFERRAEHVPPDPSKSVYAYFYSHLVPPCKNRRECVPHASIRALN